VLVVDDCRPSTFPRGRGAASSQSSTASSSSSPSAAVVSGGAATCTVADCCHHQLSRVDSFLSQSASSGSSGIGSMGLCDTLPGSSSLRTAPLVPVHKRKCCSRWTSTIRRTVYMLLQNGVSVQPASVAQWAETQCAPTKTVCRRGGVQSPGRPVDFVFGFQGRML